MAFDTANDLNLPGARMGTPHFMMCPVAQDRRGRFDSYAPDDLRYQITARELEA